MRKLQLLSALLAGACLATPAHAQQQGGVYVSPSQAENFESIARANAREAAELEFAAIRAAEGAKKDEARIKAIEEEIARLEVEVAESRSKLVGLADEEASASERLRMQRRQHAAAFSAMIALSKAHGPALVAYNGNVLNSARGAAALHGLRDTLGHQAVALRERTRMLGDLRLRTEAAREETSEAIEALRSRERELWALVGKRRELSRAKFARSEELKRDAERASAQSRQLTMLLRQSPAPPPKPARNYPPTTTGFLPPPAPISRARGQFAWPVLGARIAERFGDEGLGKDALGVVFDAEAFAIVYAPWAGTVSYAGPVSGFEMVSVIDIGEKYQIILAGLATLDRQKGEAVLKGEPIGRLGGPISESEEFLAENAALGNNAVASLYLQMRLNGDPIDPGPWLEPAGLQVIRKADAE